MFAARKSGARITRNTGAPHAPPLPQPLLRPAANSTIADDKTDDGTGTGAFASTITVLSADTTYHVRAYATNAEGTAYGEDLTFSTAAASSGGSDPAPDPDPDPAPEPDPAPDPDPDAPVESTADANGTAAAGTDAVDVIVEGLPEGAKIILATDETGRSTLTVGDSLNPDLTVVVDGVAKGTRVNVSIDDNGAPSITLSNPDGSQTLDLTASGFGHGSKIVLSIDEAGNPMIVITDAAGFTTTLDLNSPPQNAAVRVSTDSPGNVSVGVANDAGDAPDVSIVASGVEGDVVFTVTFNAAPGNLATAKIVSGLSGFQDGKSLGGSVTIAASGLAEGGVVAVALTYEDADLAGINEADLRLLRLNESSGAFEPPGTRDVGDMAPTGVAGDWGYDSEKNSAWAVVSELGTFAVGVPESASAPPEDDASDTGLSDDELEAIPELTQCGAGAAPCGALGLTQSFLMVAGLAAIRRGYH